MHIRAANIDYFLKRLEDCRIHTFVSVNAQMNENSSFFMMKAIETDVRLSSCLKKKTSSFYELKLRHFFLLDIKAIIADFQRALRGIIKEDKRFSRVIDCDNLLEVCDRNMQESI